MSGDILPPQSGLSHTTTGLSQTQNYTIILSDFTVTTSLSSLIGCFFQAQWQALLVILSLNEDLEMAMFGYAILWCWMKIYPSMNPDWPKT